MAQLLIESGEGKSTVEAVMAFFVRKYILACDRRLLGLGMMLMLGLPLVSGCLPIPSLDEPEKVATPPYIPVPPEKMPTPIPLVADNLDMYSDLMDANDTSFHPELREAAFQAIERGVLKPANLEDRFEPKKMITYGEFRQWVAKYQGTLKTASADSVSMTSAIINSERGGPTKIQTSTAMSQAERQPTAKTSGSKPIYEMKAVSEARPTANTPGKFSQTEVKIQTHAVPPVQERTSKKAVNAEALPLGKPAGDIQPGPASDGQPQNHLPKGLPPEQTLGSVTLKDGMFVSREMLCALYAQLSGQEAKARSLRMEELEAPDDKGPITKTLGAFKDNQEISGWAKPYVAMAAQNKILQTVFSLTPEVLTTDSSLQPKREITREEALILLHHLYGSKQPHLKKVKSSPALRIRVPTEE